MTISVIIPFRPSNNQEVEANYNFVYKYLSSGFDEVVTGTDSGLGPFNRSMAINDGFKKSTGDILVICDADLLIRYDVIRRACKFIRNKWYSSVSPYGTVYKVQKKYSDHIKSSGIDSINWLEATQYCDMVIQNAVGGAIIVSRETYLLVNGHDERFVGWGGEDDAFHWSLLGINGVKSHTRIYSQVLHLYHPKLTWINKNQHELANALLDKYSKLHTSRLKMIEFVKQRAGL